MYTYSLFMLRFGRKQQNFIKQLSFNKKKNKMKKKDTNIVSSLNRCSHGGKKKVSFFLLPLYISCYNL